MIKEHIKTIEGIQARLNTGLLETMIYIADNPGEFTIAELRAYYSVRSEFELLFAPA